MEINQDTLNYLFKELFAIGSLQHKTQNELNDLLQYYTLQETRMINQFYHHQIVNELEIKLINRFVARISEAYQLMIAKRQITRIKDSKFQTTVLNCLTQTFETKNGIMCALISAIYQECRLQIELLTTKSQSSEVKRIHSQENRDEEQLQNQYYSMQVTNKKNNQNDWQNNMKNNKKLNEFYSKKFSKLYDVMTGIEKAQDEQILYFQSREQNMERMFNQLMQQNSHIQESLNWANKIGAETINRQIELKLQKMKLHKILPNQQLSTQSSPTKPSQPSVKSIKQEDSVSPFTKLNSNTYKMPLINLKSRSISQNVPLSETHLKKDNNIFIQQSEAEKTALFTKIMDSYKQNQFQLNKIRIEFKPIRQPCNVLKSKLMIDLIPLHNSKLKPRGTRSFLQQL